MKIIVPRAVFADGSFTRASSATHVDPRGIVVTSGSNVPRYENGAMLLEAAATNLLTYSGALSNAAWYVANGTVAAGGSPPDGSGAATAVTRTATGDHYVVQILTTTSHASKTYTLSIWLKAGTMTGSIVISIADGSGVVAGTLTVTPTSSWVRYSVTGAFGASPNANIRSEINPANNTGSAGDTFYAWGGQLEEATAKTSYIPTTSAAATRAGRG